MNASCLIANLATGDQDQVCYICIPGIAIYLETSYNVALLSSTFCVVMFIMLYKVNLTFESVDKILKLYQSVNATEQLLSCGTVFFVLLKVHNM